MNVQNFSLIDWILTMAYQYVPMVDGKALHNPSDYTTATMILASHLGLDSHEEAVHLEETTPNIFEVAGVYLWDEEVVITDDERTIGKNLKIVCF